MEDWKSQQKWGCSVNGVHCPQKLLLQQYYCQDKNRIGMMSLETFKSCLDKVPLGTGIYFAGMAEPWLNPSCADMVLYAAGKGFPIAMYTTLVDMTLEDFERIKDIAFEEFVLHIPDGKGNTDINIDENYIKVLQQVVDYESATGKLVTSYSCHAGIHSRIADIVPEGKLITELCDRAGNLEEEDGLQSKSIEGSYCCVKSGLDLNHNVLLPDGTML